MWMGQGQNRIDNFADINWSKSSVKTLGVHFGYDQKGVELKKKKKKKKG